MDKKDQRFSEYLFAKMGSRNNSLEHVVVGIGEDSNRKNHPTTTKPTVSKTKTESHHYSNKDDDTKQSEFKKWLLDNLMLLVTLSGVILGVIIGLSLRQFNLSKDTIMLIAYPGELFMRVLKLMILPLVIASLIAGSASLNAKMNGKIALRTLIYFVSTSLFNSLLGITLVTLIHPGDAGMHKNMEAAVTSGKAVSLMDSLLDLGRNIFPDNLFQASFQQAHTVYVPKKNPFELNETEIQTAIPDNVNQFQEEVLVRSIQYRSGTNTLGIVFFCLVFGTLLGTIGEKGKVVINFFTAVFEVIMKMVTGIMWLTPIGISSVIAGKILDVENLSLIMAQLLWFILTVAIGVFFYQLVVMQTIYFLILKKNPFKYYCQLIQPMLTAFATASTAAALPITFRVMEEKLRTDTRITRFVLPIGCNINMDGTALYISVAAIFIAQMSGMELGFAGMVTVFLTSTAASMSSASVPSAALVLLIMVLTAIDAPIQDVTLLFAIDWFVDRIRTTNNMLGDCYAAAIVEALSKKELMACDAVSFYRENSPINSNDRIPSSELDRKEYMPELIVVELSSVADQTKPKDQKYQI